MTRAILSILILVAGITAIAEYQGKKVSVLDTDRHRGLQAKYGSHFHYDQPYYQNFAKIREFTACGDTAMVSFNGNHKPISEFFRKRMVHKPVYVKRPEW